MNPACAFREIGEKARSVIVTSGTLSPMISFASELGIPFPGAPLTTGHVVPQDQVRPIVVHLSLHLQRALESAADWRMVRLHNTPALQSATASIGLLDTDACFVCA